MTPQRHLRLWLSARLGDMGITKAQAARAIGVDESAVRRMLAEHSDIRIDLERHLIPLMNLLRLSAAELGFVWLDAHGLAVDVVPRAVPEPGDFDDERPTLVLLGELAEAQGGLVGLATGAKARGSVSTPQAAQISAAGQRTARLARTVAARVVRRAR